MENGEEPVRPASFDRGEQRRTHSIISLWSNCAKRNREELTSGGRGRGGGAKERNG